MTAQYPVDASGSGPAIGPEDPLDAALAAALSAAVSASRLDLVSAIVEELRARRLAVSGNVLDLARRNRR